jgi:hypothetical protein
VERAGRFWKLISIAVGAIAAALVVSVSIRSNGSDATAQRFVVPDGYTGVVWVGVPASEETFSLHIEWGAWAIDQTIGPNDPRTWRFDRLVRGADEPTLPIFITVTPDVPLDFGYDSLPPGTRGLPKEKWYPLDGDGP